MQQEILVIVAFDKKHDATVVYDDIADQVVSFIVNSSTKIMKGEPDMVMGRAIEPIDLDEENQYRYMALYLPYAEGARTFGVVLGLGETQEDSKLSMHDGAAQLNVPTTGNELPFEEDQRFAGLIPNMVMMDLNNPLTRDSYREIAMLVKTGVNAKIQPSGTVH